MNLVASFFSNLRILSTLFLLRVVSQAMPPDDVLGILKFVISFLSQVPSRTLICDVAEQL